MIFQDLLQPSNTCNVVLTRAKSRQSQEVNETNSLKCLPFYDYDIPTHPVKPVMSKSEKRLDKFQGKVVQVTDGEGSEKLSLEWQIPANMFELQKTHSEIGPIYSRMIENVKQGREMAFLKGSTFCLENELLYRKDPKQTTNGSSYECTQHGVENGAFHPLGQSFAQS